MYVYDLIDDSFIIQSELPSNLSGCAHYWSTQRTLSLDDLPPSSIGDLTGKGMSFFTESVLIIVLTLNCFGSIS